MICNCSLLRLARLQGGGDTQCVRNAFVKAVKDTRQKVVIGDVGLVGVKPRR